MLFIGWIRETSKSLPLPIQSREEMRQRKHKRPKCHEQDTASNPSWLRSMSTEIADRKQTYERCDFRWTDDETHVLAREVEAFFETRYGHHDKAAKDHFLSCRINWVVWQYIQYIQYMVRGSFSTLFFIVYRLSFNI